jgi:hypothetical protein
MTIRIDGELHRRVKEAASASHRTISQLVEDVLRDALAAPRVDPAIRPLPRFGGSGLRAEARHSDSDSIGNPAGPDGWPPVYDLGAHLDVDDIAGVLHLLDRSP